MNHIDTINYQHSEVLKKLELIISPDRSVKAIEDFLKYVMFHFNYETKIQEDIGYPELQDHVLEHDYTISEIKSLLLRHKVDFAEEYDISIIKNIIIDHINNHDTRLMKYITDNGY
jgi:hemerythrin